MAKRVAPKAGKTQFVWEGILKWFAFAIMCLQLALGVLMYIFSDELSAKLFRVEKWAVIVLILTALAYVLYTKAKAPRLMFRIKDFTKGLFRPEFTILVVFFVWCIFCTMSADNRYAADFFRLSDSSLFDTFVSVFVIFIMAYVFRGDSALKMVRILFHVFCSLLTVFMIYVLYVLCKPGIINLPGGGQIGLTAGLRLSINCNPNTTGAISELIFLMCLYMVIARKGILRWLYAAAALVHYVILVLSNSRTCIYAAGIAVAALAGKLCYDAVKDRALWQRILATAAAAAAAGGLVVGMRIPVFAAFESISHFSELLGYSSSGGDSGGAVSAAAAAAAAVRDADSTFGSRVDLWIASVKSVFQDAKHFFFGVTPAGVASEMSIWDESHKQLYTHNQFCEVAVAHGIPGMAMYLLWLVMIAGSCVRIVSGKIKQMSKEFIGVAGIILMLVVSNLTEATLMYYRFLTEGVFFLLCGMVTYQTDRKKA